jgi:hypothetical protein
VHVRCDGGPTGEASGGGCRPYTYEYIGTAAEPIFTHASDWTPSDDRFAGMFTRLKGGFYHDRRFATLDDVVNHYDGCLNLQLSLSEKSDLVQYLLTL